MPLLPYSPNSIELPVSDRVFQDTILKQKAWFDLMEIKQLRAGSSEVKLWVELTAYAKNGDGYGDPLPVPVRRLPLLADNNTAVDPTTGELRYLLITPVSVRNLLTGELLLLTEGQDWPGFLNAQPEALLLQGDFFSLVRDTQDVRIHQLIVQHIQQADSMGRFA